MVWIVLGMIWIVMLILDPPRTAILTLIGGLVFIVARQLWVWLDERKEGGP